MHKIIFLKNGETQLLIPESKAVEARIFMLQKTPRPKEEIPAEVEDAVTPLVWASGIPGRSKLAEPVKVVLKSGTKPVRQKQYPIKWEARKGLEELITKFLNYGLLIECESEYNTPILPVKKQNSKEYRLVQDLRAVNQIVQDIDPVVANPYTLLTSLKEKHKWFTVLDLKDAFFCIPLDKDSQAYLPLNGKAPPLDARHNSPGRCYLKGSKLTKELEAWKKENSEGIILQYVDDILIAAETREDCLQVTISLLNFLGQAGYQVSKSKAQIGKETVIYLGFEILQGQRRLGAGRKEAICQVPEPRTIGELRTFLGMARWCRLWILNYAALKGSQENHLLWTPECRTAFKNLKKALMSAPALGLPDLAKPFECLYMSDNILLWKSGGKQYVLVRVEVVSGLTQTEAIAQATRDNTVKGLKLWFSYLPKPQSIQSDNGIHFTTGVVQEWAKGEGIQWVFHTPYYPQANGIVERTNGLLKIALKPHNSGWPARLSDAVTKVNGHWG
ncbi:hypothetical protein QYF61_019764, partial [Mycteria americana]